MVSSNLWEPLVTEFTRVI